MKHLLFGIIAWLLPTVTTAENRTYKPEVKSLQAVVNQDWLSPTVMQLKGDDVLNIGFDELSHNYHRYVYRLERCEADWTTSEELFESDWLEGFNNNVIDDYVRSINTTVPYTHYKLQIPNDMPPTFLVTAIDDPVVMYQNSVNLDRALTAKGIPHMFLLYETGGHGYGMDESKAGETAKWRYKFVQWLHDINILP